MWMSVQTAPVMWMRTATTCPAPLSVPVDLVSLETVYNVSVSKEQRYQSINLWWVGEVLEELIFYILSLSVGEVRLCGDDVCHPNARCVFNSDIGRPMCECNSGYYGDGKNCTTLGLSNKTCSLSLIEELYSSYLSDIKCLIVFQRLSVTRPPRSVTRTPSVSTTFRSSAISVSVGRGSVGMV